MNESKEVSTLGIDTEYRRRAIIKYIPVEEETDNKYPINAFVGPLLTDLYQLTMAYSYWKNKKQDSPAIFDLFFRKNPFKGEFTIFAGLEEVIRYISCFKFGADDIERVRQIIPSCDEGYFEYLATLDASKVKVYAMKEGTLCFPKVPLIRLEGPLAVLQIMETTLLVLVNFPSLVATNAARHCLAAGPGKSILEFGLRRAQGPDGGVSASRYTYIGGCSGTSNVLAATLYNIPCKGTHAHSFVTSFTSDEVLTKSFMVSKKDGQKVNLEELCATVRKELGIFETNKGELKAFIAYACGFPNGFLALIDTYDTLQSGARNFIIVATAIHRLGYKAIGIRLDSGDLAYLSKQCRIIFHEFADRLGSEYDYFRKFTIVASNDINEDTLLSLNNQGHEIDAFGVGTNLVTCQAQPALGCVFKLVEINNVARIKLSNEIEKVTIPGGKDAYRLFGPKGHPLIDVLVKKNDDKDVPEANKKLLCRHPFNATKRAYVIPAKVEPLLHLWWDGQLVRDLPSIEQIREYTKAQLASMRPDYIRNLNPTPYKVAVTNGLYQFLHNLWQEEQPIGVLSD